MKDSHKGLIFILLAILASTAAFFDEDRRWEMAFINYTPETNEIDEIQSQILAGLDPTLVTEPTAAGHKIPKAIAVRCLEGEIARNNPHSRYHGNRYIAVKQEGNTYIEIPEVNVLLLKTNFNVQSATQVEAFPIEVSQSISNAVDSAECSQIDLYLARIKFEH